VRADKPTLRAARLFLFLDPIHTTTPGTGWHLGLARRHDHVRGQDSAIVLRAVEERLRVCHSILRTGESVCGRLLQAFGVGDDLTMIEFLGVHMPLAWLRAQTHSRKGGAPRKATPAYRERAQNAILKPQATGARAGRIRLLWGGPLVKWDGPPPYRHSEYFVPSRAVLSEPLTTS
jgi:hypothetical protein